MAGAPGPPAGGAPGRGAPGPPAGHGATGALRAGGASPRRGLALTSAIMSVILRWVGDGDLDRIARVRTLCYALGPKELEHPDRVLRADPRPKPGDFLLAEEDGEPVGTTTALSLIAWVRGSPVPCQGIAYVGTIRTRRRGGAGGERGIASQLMHEALRVARERGQ